MLDFITVPSPPFTFAALHFPTVHHQHHASPLLLRAIFSSTVCDSPAPTSPTTLLSLLSANQQSTWPCPRLDHITISAATFSTPSATPLSLPSAATCPSTLATPFLALFAIPRSPTFLCNLSFFLSLKSHK
ncbi:hypothetical protein AMTRI_Chr12g270070 [Amborella trichopoda]